MRRLWCRLMRHDHGKVVIMCQTAECGPITSQAMDRWSADYIITNMIAPEAEFAGHVVTTCRIVVL